MDDGRTLDGIGRKRSGRIVRQAPHPRPMTVALRFLDFDNSKLLASAAQSLLRDVLIGGSCAATLL
jgi:hypothetical protein